MSMSVKLASTVKCRINVILNNFHSKTKLIAEWNILYNIAIYNITVYIILKCNFFDTWRCNDRPRKQLWRASYFLRAYLAHICISCRVEIIILYIIYVYESTIPNFGQFIDILH